MSIASEIQRLQQAKADIKAVLEGKGIPVSPTLKIDGYAELIDLCLVPDTRVAVKYNVTDTSNPTKICYSSSVSKFSAIEIDGVAQPSVVSSYTFSTTGIHIVWFTLADPTSIGKSAFQSCSALTSVTIPNSVTSIGSHAFHECSRLTSVAIPDSVTSIDSYAFYNCSALTSVTIPNSMTSIGNSAFQSCSGLTSVSIPSSVTRIGFSTFYNCSLTSVTIPSNVTSIGNRAFWCPDLTSISVESGNSVYDSRNNCNAIIETGTNTLIQGCKTTIIPNSVTSIGDSAFRNCFGLTSVTIPNSVTSIGENAFESCTGLTSVHITDIAAWCNVSFYNNYSNPLYYVQHLYMNGSEITDLVIPNGVTSIGDRAFYNCSGLTSVTIPNSVTSIGISAFFGCSGLTSVSIPNSVTEIGSSAFSGCSGLTSITIPNGVTSIGSSAFRRCAGLNSIISNATTAPTIASSTFREVKTGGILTVPSGSTGYDTWMGTGNYYLGKYNWTKVEQ